MSPFTQPDGRPGEGGEDVTWIDTALNMDSAPRLSVALAVSE